MFRSIKKKIDSLFIIVDIEDYNDIQEIIEINESEKKCVIVLNKIINARLLEHRIVLLKHQYFPTVELYLFLFDEKLSASDLAIYNSMRTLKVDSLI